MATMVEPYIDFENAKLTDFSDPANRRAMEEALEKVRGELGRTYPLVIGGERIAEGETGISVNPVRPDEVVGRFVQATAEHADRALGVAAETFETWRHTSAEERADYLFRAADLMDERRLELAAWMVFEVSKSWVEADADVAELIDFARYYARQALRIGGLQPVVQFPGEHDEMRYIPLGVAAVIPPWNFPSAIMGGMTLAAVVTGNTVVLKPASTSPVIAAKFVEIMEEVGLPAGVINFVPGPGGKIGDLIVDDPRTRMIAFTGSKEVGLRIYERAAKVHPGQRWLKRTILEMGGKDSIVVDETADLDAAAEGITMAAFGFQGQKCSACSRAIIVDDVYDEVLERVVERTRQLTIGDPADEGTFMGAVIDDKAHKKISEYIEIGKDEGRLAFQGEAPADGYFVPPTVIADVDPDARISQEEIFGPVLAFIRARDYDHALEIANNTEYGLTGAVYSHDRGRLERARHEFHVGNLYLNRKCTGALVGVHPFGGFNMSGTDSKAGGPDYLLLFTQAKSIAERLRDDVPVRPDPVGKGPL
ncbi:MAG TPA: L-glutamate gamma-semialdehyde dehydrogenase [Longimicrobiales bacterium]|nr:L-glutamate gamma-semialdehyde dehydrogenase [Longimicrobiales bacterium]